MNRPDGLVPVLVARQAGTAMAFLPLLDHLPSETTLFAYDSVGEMWSGHETRRVEEFADAAPLLDPGRTSVLITGTSLCVADDAAWWTWAATHGVRSVAFVDQWVNYWQRFSSDPSTKFDVLPDVVGVVDEVARDRMVESGCPPERITVTGTPLLDLVSGRGVERDGAPQRQILFAAEPSSTAGDASEAALRDLASALSTQRTVAVHLVVSRHPAQGEPIEVDTLETDGVTVTVSESASVEERMRLLRSSDVVVGLGSILLFLSASAGIPTLSATYTGYDAADLLRAAPAIDPVEKKSDLGLVLERALAAGRRETGLVEGAASARFLAALGVEQR